MPPKTPAQAAATEPIPLPEPIYSRDAELVQACLAGDNEAWKTLLSRYNQLIYSIPRKYRLDADDAADVYQTVSLALWNGLAKLRSEKALTNWIVVTTSRQAEKVARRRRRQVAQGEAGSEESEKALQKLAAPAEDPLAGVAEVRLKHELQRAMDRLPQRCVDLLTRLYLVEEQPDYDTLSAELGIPRGSLGPTRGRCLEKLKKLYEKG